MTEIDPIIDEGLAWVDGQVVGARAATVSVFDRGFTLGDGLFETLLVREGIPLAWTRHLDRFSTAADRLEIEIPRSPEQLRAIVDELTNVWTAAGGGDARLRITLSRGSPPTASGTEPTLVASLTALGTIAPTATVVRVPWVLNERSATTGIKTTSYIDHGRALAAAHRAGASEAIMANTQGNLCEGSATNVFVVIDGTLSTPPLTSGCLPGVTRALVLASGCGAVERDIPFDALDDVEEMFITSSIRGLQPVTAIDGRRLSSAHGQHTTRALLAFSDLAADLDP